MNHQISEFCISNDRNLINNNFNKLYQNVLFEVITKQSISPRSHTTPERKYQQAFISQLKRTHPFICNICRKEQSNFEFSRKENNHKNKIIINYFYIIYVNISRLRQVIENSNYLPKARNPIMHFIHRYVLPCLHIFCFPYKQKH